MRAFLSIFGFSVFIVAIMILAILRFESNDNMYLASSLTSYNFSDSAFVQGPLAFYFYRYAGQILNFQQLKILNFLLAIFVILNFLQVKTEPKERKFAFCFLISCPAIFIAWSELGNYVLGSFFISLLSKRSHYNNKYFLVDLLLVSLATLAKISFLPFYAIPCLKRFLTEDGFFKKSDLLVNLFKVGLAFLILILFIWRIYCYFDPDFFEKIYTFHAKYTLDYREQLSTGMFSNIASTNIQTALIIGYSFVILGFKSRVNSIDINGQIFLYVALLSSLLAKIIFPQYFFIFLVFVFSNCIRVTKWQRVRVVLSVAGLLVYSYKSRIMRAPDAQESDVRNLLDKLGSCRETNQVYTQSAAWFWRLFDTKQYSYTGPDSSYFWLRLASSGILAENNKQVERELKNLNTSIVILKDSIEDESVNLYLKSRIERSHRAFGGESFEIFCPIR